MKRILPVLCFMLAFASLADAAVDTAPKRRSMMNLMARKIGPSPDGTIDAADRTQLAGLYNGFAAGGGGSSSSNNAQAILLRGAGG